MKVSMFLPDFVPGAPSGLMAHVESLLEVLEADVELFARTKADHPRIKVVRSAPAGPFLAPLLGGDKTAKFIAEVVSYNLAAYHAALSVPTDIVHAHDWLGAIAGPALAKAKGVPLVLTLHSTETGRGQGAGCREIVEMERAAVAAADRVIVASHFMREQARDLSCSEERIRIVPHGLPLERIAQAPAAPADELRAELGVGHAPLAVFIGRLSPVKGCRELMAAFTLAARKVMGSHLVFAGSGPEAAHIEATAEAKNLSGGIHILPGTLTSERKWGLIDAADVVVLPSLYEPFGLVAMEAMARGRTVLVSSLGGCAELVEDGRTGLVRDPRDKYAFSEALTQLLSDEALRKAMGDAGRERAQAYSLAAMGEGTMSVYEELARD